MAKTFKNRLQALYTQYARAYKRYNPDHKESYQSQLASFQKSIQTVLAAGANSYRDLRHLAGNKALAPAIRQAAIYLLLERKDKKASPLFVHLFLHGDEIGHEIRGIWSPVIAKRDLKHLTQVLLHHPEMERRYEAAYILCWVDSNKYAFDTLLEVLQNQAEDPKVRGQAAEGLGYIGDKRALPALLAALEHDSVILRWDVVFALGAIADPLAIPILENIIATDHRPIEVLVINGKPRTISEEAAEALEHLQNRLTWQQR